MFVVETKCIQFISYFPTVSSSLPLYNFIIFYGELLQAQSTQHYLEDHPLSAVSYSIHSQLHCISGDGRTLHIWSQATR